MKSGSMKYVGRTLLALVGLLVSAAIQAQNSYYDPVEDVMVPIIIEPPPPYPAEKNSLPQRPDQRSFSLKIRFGRVVSGPTELSVNHGADIILTLESQYATSVQIDGYELQLGLPAGHPVVLRFNAQRPGRFVIREANSTYAMAVLEVGPPALSSSQRPAATAPAADAPAQPRPIPLY